MAQSEPTPAAAASDGAAVLDSRYEIQPRAVLPDMAPTRTTACAALDLRDPGQPVYAVVTNPALPPRVHLLQMLCNGGW